jgi:preprotein translocase subunit SecD
VDANVTTLIAAIVLLQFGTGPVKGFAVTLSLGIAASMFTAIFGTRLLFDYLLQKRRMKTLSI